MARIANKSARKLVQSCTPFQGSNLFAENKHNSYVVYSYGYHHPLYAYNRTLKQWYANSDKVSRSTSKHYSQAHPHVSLKYGSTKALERVIYHDDDSYTSRYPETEPQLQRDPERETISLLKVKTDYFKSIIDRSRCRSGRMHYIDTLPSYLQHKVAILKLLPPGAYLDGIGGITLNGVIILNTTKPE